MQLIIMSLFWAGIKRDSIYPLKVIIIIIIIIIIIDF